MVPCSRDGADSMRQASIAMSWVAAEKASHNAKAGNLRPPAPSDR